MTEHTMTQKSPSNATLVAVLGLSLGILACGGNPPPTARPAPPAPESGLGDVSSSPPPTGTEPRSVPPEPALRDESIASASLDDLNRSSPLRPLFFAYDSSEVTADGRAVLDANAAVLRQNPTWTVTIEGHCDERGTAEYNLSLGERRAVAARDYFISLGVPANRLRTVSYGKEFPFDPGQTEDAWARNRRAHFVITAR
jgi:peptidoglycan-associated lipoprotein